jgi:esterase/lipase superfamily enzyme
VTYASQYAARKVLLQARKEKRDILFFVHGYNNDVDDILRRAEQLATNFGVTVVAFTWPANGGGILTGVPSYKSDKRDARASAGAFDRTLAKIADYIDSFTQEARDDAWARAQKAHPDNDEAGSAVYARFLETGCPFTINLMLHSMGNYLLKQVLKTTAGESNRLVFDNIVMVAADTNNLDHTLWVDRLRFRHRIYITINENDMALAASRVKGGEEQLARLGHHPFHLNARNAIYVNFTGAAHVGKSHAYFEAGSLQNKAIRLFFQRAFKGDTGESDLRFHPDKNFYTVKA